MEDSKAIEEKLKSILTNANHQLKSSYKQETNKSVVSLLYGILETQVITSEYWLKSKDRSIEYIINLAEQFRAKCEVLENELTIATKRIKVLDNDVEQYTKAIDVLNKQIYEKDNRIKALTEAFFEALKVIKKCKYK